MALVTTAPYNQHVFMGRYANSGSDSAAETAIVTDAGWSLSDGIQYYDTTNDRIRLRRDGAWTDVYSDSDFVTTSTADSPVKLDGSGLLNENMMPDLTDYAKLAGRAGGQTLIGGTGDSDDLVLQSTSHVNKGVVQISGCNLDLGSNKIINVAAGTDGTDAVNKNQLDNAINGLTWKDPVDVLKIKSDADQSGADPTAGETGEAWLVNNWLNETDGDIVEWSGSAWVVIVANSGGEPPDGTRVLVIDSGAAGSFAGEEFSFGVYDATGNSWSFTAPVNGDAVLIAGGSSVYENQGFVFDDTPSDAWVQFAGSTLYTGGTGIDITGSVVSIDDWSLDAAYDNLGSGAGRVITVDSGAVEFTGSNASDYTVEVTNSANGGALFVNNSGSGNTIDLQDSGSSVFTISGAAALTTTSLASANFTTSGTFEVNASTNFSIEGATSSDVTVAGSGQTLTLEASGGGANQVIVQSAGTGTEAANPAIYLNATAGGVNISAALASSFTVASGDLTLEATSGDVDIISAASNIDFILGSTSIAAVTDEKSGTYSGENVVDVKSYMVSDWATDETLPLLEIIQTPTSAPVSQKMINLEAAGSNWSADFSQAIVYGKAPNGVAVLQIADTSGKLETSVGTITGATSSIQGVAFDRDDVTVQNGVIWTIGGVSGANIEFMIVNVDDDALETNQDSRLDILATESVLPVLCLVNYNSTEARAGFGNDNPVCTIDMSPGTGSALTHSNIDMRVNYKTEWDDEVYHDDRAYFADGAAGTPSIAFHGDTGTNTGLYLPAQGTVGVSADGSLIASFAAAEIDFSNITAFDVNASGAITLDGGASSNLTVTEDTADTDVTLTLKSENNGTPSGATNHSTLALVSYGAATDADAEGWITFDDQALQDATNWANPMKVSEYNASNEWDALYTALGNTEMTLVAAITYAITTGTNLWQVVANQLTPIATYSTVGLDINATGTNAITLDAQEDSNFTVTGSAKTLTLEAAGGSTNQVILQSAGTGVNALYLNASAGGVDIDASGGVTVDAGGAVSIAAASASDFTVSNSANLTLAVTGGSVQQLILNSAGTGNIDTTPAMDINATAGGIDIDAAGKSAFTVTGADLKLETVTSGTVDINSAASVTIDATDVTIDATNSLSFDAAADSNYTLTQATTDTGLTLTLFVDNNGSGASDSTLILRADESGSGTASIAHTINGTTEGTWTSSGLALKAGTSINEFSIDGTMAGNSDDAVPTEKAVVTYVGSYAPQVHTNAGNPEGVVTGAVGDICVDTTNTIVYIKASGAGNTGWSVAA